MAHVRWSSPSRKSSIAVWLLFLLLPLTRCLAQQAGAEISADPIQPGIWRLDGITPGLPSTDLEPLRQRIGKATVVAFGESYHASGGFLDSKHRVFRDLVEKGGFRAIALESPWSAADSVAAYVKTCSGSPEEALRGVDVIWQGEEVLDLVNWMCTWNRTHKKAKDRVDFLGFDIRQPEVDAPALIAFLARIGVAGDDPLVAGVQRCNGVSGPRAPRGGVQVDDHEACMASLDGIAQKFANEARAIAKKTKKDFDWAKLRLLSLRSWQGNTFYDGRDFTRADEERDAGMAAVLLALQKLRLPKNTKVVTWGHNFHISKAPLRGGPGGVSNTMGTFLTAALGAKYFAVGVIGWTVAVDDGGQCGVVRMPAGTSVEAKLHDLHEDFLLVDTTVESPVLSPGSLSQISGFTVIPPDHFNALLYLDESPQMIPLGRPPC